MGKIFVFDHPLVQHKISKMRDKNTTTKDFRDLAKEIGILMAYEATKEMPLEPVEIETPIAKATVNMLTGEQPVIVPILRAGLGLVDSMLTVLPNGHVGHVGMARNPETHMPEEYYCKLPDRLEQRKIFIVDPMLATGGSAIDAIDLVKRKGGKDITFICLLASQEGLDAVSKAHPDVDIYAAAKDEKLNENAYIVPGLGDAGDRLYGTL